MAPPTMSQEYAELMQRQGEGHYLYKPQPLRDLHPGAVGFFDPHGRWTTIADLTAPTSAQLPSTTSDDLTPCPHPLQLAAPVHEEWHIRTSGRDAERHFGLTAGLSGLLAAAAPLETSADAGYTTGKTGHAALVVTAGPVTSRALRPPYLGPVRAWVRANAKTLLTPSTSGDAGAFAEEIRRYGLWVVVATWSARGCATRLAAGAERERKVGAEAGAPDLMGKLGAEVGWKAKLESEGWTAFAAEGDKEEDELVVSFGGIGFARSAGRAVFGGRVLVESATYRMAEPITLTLPTTRPRPLLNDEGEQIGTQFYRPVLSAAGTLEGQWIPEVDSSSPSPSSDDLNDSSDILHDLDHPTTTLGLPPDTLETLSADPAERAFADEQSRAEAAASEARAAVNRAFVHRALELETSVSARHERTTRLRALLAEGEKQEGAWEALGEELFAREQRRREEAERPMVAPVPELEEVRGLRFEEGDAEGPVEIIEV